MTTLEMLNEAQKTNNIYITENMRYSVLKGFHDDRGKKWNGSAFEYVNEIFEIDDWKLLKRKKMTLSQIEEALGYSIELVSSTP